MILGITKVMDIRSIVKSLDNCPCGAEHKSTLQNVEIGHGYSARVGEFLDKYNFPKNILLVADNNTIKASPGVEKSLIERGFNLEYLIYDDLRIADIKYAKEVSESSRKCDAVLSVGTGSLNDICRYGAHLAIQNGHKLSFAIFATAPSMDGFASASAPITENGFKTTRQAIQPDVIIADTAILASSPDYLKSAGFGDMLAKYIALTDWRISNLLTGEHYCQSIANLTREALKRITSLAQKVTANDEETAEAIMESLIFTGIAMALANSVRPASGAEHMISHYWEMKKAEKGEISDFHGKKVGIATLYLTRLYHALADIEQAKCKSYKIDFDNLKSVIGDNFIDDVFKMNSPSVTDNIDPKLIENNWQNIRKIVKEELPTPEQMLHLMKLANCATTPLEADIDNDLARDAMIYHPYLRHRLTLSHLVSLIKGADNVRSNILKEYYNI